MKCPTCGYIGFETADRCRNCGYEFSLAPKPEAPPEMAIRERAADGPLSDLTIQSPAPAGADPAGRAPDLDRVLQNLDRVFGAPEPDLPLFGDSDPADLPPLVTPPATPRRPLSVRRTTPDPSRLRSRPSRPPRPSPTPTAPQPLELPLPDDPAPIGAGLADPPVEPTEAPGAPPMRRTLAALIDLTILGVIDVVVVYFTLRLCGLATADLAVLPLIPLVAFFLVVNGGYLVAFTAAGGQTIGKMALGLKVVGHAELPVSPGLSLLRAAGCIGSLCSLGLGYVPALLADGGRALEDRLADTRVVRVATT